MSTPSGGSPRAGSEIAGISVSGYHSSTRKIRTHFIALGVFIGTGGSLAGADGRSRNDQRRTWSIPRAPHSLHQSAELAEGAESCSFLPIGEIILRLCNTQSSICRPAHDFHSPPPTYTCIYQHTFNFALRTFLSNKR